MRIDLLSVGQPVQVALHVLLHLGPHLIPLVNSPAGGLGPLLGELSRENTQDEVHHEESPEDDEGAEENPLPAVAFGILELQMFVIITVVTLVSHTTQYRTSVQPSRVTHWKTVNTARMKLSKFVIPKFGPIQYSLHTSPRVSSHWKPPPQGLTRSCRQ